ncbi:MAG: rhamnan synthesis F family protein [Acidiferrobacteraceae bacterium]
MGANSRGAPLAPDLDLERDILSASGLFDVDWYRQSAGEDAQSDPIGHYLTSGWREALEPSASFPGAFFLPYFAAAGFDEPPAITWLTLKSAGWPTYETRESVEAEAAAVRATGLFDESIYAARAGLGRTGLDPATHYVLVGEGLRVAPSIAFDPAYYADRYPDVGMVAINLLLHYADHGRAEGRWPLPLVPIKAGGRFDPRKENVLLVVHEMSRTGAPILGWNIGVHLARTYNVFTVCLGDGALKRDFEKISAAVLGPLPVADRDSVIEHSLRSLLDAYKFRYALVNTLECRVLVEPCMRRFIPTVLLVHEFSAYYLRGSLSQVLDLSTEVVFSAPIVARNAEEHYSNLAIRTVRILPQGPSRLPTAVAPVTDAQAGMLAGLRHQRQAEGAFVVLGAGTVHLRKGVDIFLAVAAAVQRAGGRRPVHFVWVGHGFLPNDDMQYSAYLQEQLNRSGLVGRVTFLGEVADMEPAYAIADAFLLSSRLDPLPNVAIDAALRGIPIVCFKGASGMADLLQSNPETATCVVEHLDAEAAARVILGLASDKTRLAEVVAATMRFAQGTFDMEAYVASLDTLASAAASRVAQQEVDAGTLLSDPSFAQDMFLGPSPGVESRRESIARYLAVSGTRRLGERSTLQDVPLRRPSPGFNPKVYVASNAALYDYVDPLADFVRRGKPRGPWQAPVIGANDSQSAACPSPGKLRVALHAHFFYPELAKDFVARIQANRTPCDLLISTNDAEKAEVLTRALSAYAGGEAKVRIAPNRGRNIGPLLTAFADDLLHYDVIGHVHGKRSLSTDQAMGELWRTFLWENLLGGQSAMMDRIIAQFEQEAELGLVFPSDPHIMGWSANRTLGTLLLERMGYASPLPDDFDFPVGTMFWVRVDALRPLLTLALGWHDYPPEPLPYDGTILHALERVFPFAAQLAGFSYSVTHVPGISR